MWKLSIFFDPKPTNRITNQTFSHHSYTWLFFLLISDSFCIRSKIQRAIVNKQAIQRCGRCYRIINERLFSNVYNFILYYVSMQRAFCNIAQNRTKIWCFPFTFTSKCHENSFFTIVILNLEIDTRFMSIHWRMRSHKSFLSHQIKFSKNYLDLIVVQMRKFWISIA